MTAPSPGVTRRACVRLRGEPAAEHEPDPLGGLRALVDQQVRLGGVEGQGGARGQYELLEADLDLELAAQQEGELGAGVPHQLARRAGPAARLVGHVHEVHQVRKEVAEQLPAHPGLELELAPVIRLDELAAQLGDGHAAGRAGARADRGLGAARGRAARTAARRSTPRARSPSRRSCSPTAASGRSRPGTACWPEMPARRASSRSEIPCFWRSRRIRPPTLTSKKACPHPSVPPSFT